MRKRDKIKRRLSTSQSVAAGTLSIMFFTIISKGLGFVREMVLAANFGTSWRLDALLVAMDPALKLGGMIASAIASMMIPIYIEEKSKRDPELTKAYVTQVLFISSLLLLAFGLLLSLFPELLVNIFAPKFNEREAAYAI